MSNGPLPTILTSLSSLSTFPTGSKVRFLGCVTHYSQSSGTLTLQHSYPTSTVIQPVALTDVNLLLEGLKRENVQVGAWVNVMGYVEQVIKAQRPVTRREGIVGDEDSENVTVKVKAVMLWSAGGVKLGAYERALEERLQTENKDSFKRS